MQKISGNLMTSMRLRFGVGLLIVTVLPILTFGYVAQNVLLDYIRKNSIQSVGQVANAKHVQLAAYLKQSQVRALTLLTDVQRECLSDVNCQTRRLQSFISSEGAIGGRIVFQEANRFVAVGKVEADSLTRPFKEGQLAQFSGKGSLKNQAYYIQVQIPNPKQILEVVYPSGNLQEIFDNIPKELGQSGETFLADGEGYFITRARYPSTQGVSHPIHAKPMRTCLSGQSGELLDLDYRDAEIIHGFRFVPEFGAACIMAHIEQVEAFEPVSTLERWLLLAVIALLGLVIIIASLFVKSVTKPLVEFTNTMRRYANGEREIRVVNNDNNELSVLGQTFNHMAEALSQAEYDRSQVDMTLRFMANHAWTTKPGEFLPSLVSFLAGMLNIEYVFIGRLSANLMQVHTKAVYASGKLVDNFDYALSGTPCEQVISQATVCIYSHSIQSLFPNDQLLVEMGVESYCAVPLLGSNGAPLGLLAVLGKEALIDTDQIQSLLQMVSIRADVPPFFSSTGL